VDVGLLSYIIYMHVADWAHAEYVSFVRGVFIVGPIYFLIIEQQCMLKLTLKTEFETKTKPEGPDQDAKTSKIKTETDTKTLSRHENETTSRDQYWSVENSRPVPCRASYTGGEVVVACGVELV